MAKFSPREAELRAMRERALAEIEAKGAAEAMRRAHYAEVARLEAVTKIDGVGDENRLAPVTKINQGEKRGRGRPALLGKPMTGRERTLLWRARKKAEGK